MQEPEQNTVVEGEDFDDKLALTDRLLLIAALLLSLPVYLLLLFLVDDPLFSEQDSLERSRVSSQHTAQKLAIKKVAGMSFAPIQLKSINSQEELISSMICTFEPRSGLAPQSIYLRLGTFERFTATSMNTDFSRTPGKNWPDFAFSAASEVVAHPVRTADLHFFCNFEERLPHVPALQNLAGPLDFCAMRDGSIVLKQTLAVGDEFELEYVSLPRLTESDEIAEVASDSPYIILGLMDTPQLREKAVEISGTAGPFPQTVFKFVSYLEVNGLYKTDYKQTTDMHPVKEFILKSMTGYCQHFAASLMLLCRLSGIPARVVTGFSSSKGSDGRFIVVEGMAHAWVEILTTSGWKTVDVQPQHSDVPPPIGHGVALPSAAQLDSLKEKLRQENIERHNPSEQDASAPRKAQQIAMDQVFEEAQPPGTVVKDKTRAEKHQKESAEKKRKEKAKAQTQMLKSILRYFVVLILLAATAWFTISNAERLLKWLLKLLQKKRPEKELDQDNEKTLRQTLTKMLAMSEYELEGKDVIALFNSFTRLMETRGVLPRGEHETPGEYFDRLCLELNLRPTDGKLAARCFEAELYGGRNTTAADVHKFLQFVQQILNKIS